MVVIENMGDSPIDTSRIEVLDPSQDNAKLSAGSDFTWQDSTIGAGESSTLRIEGVECGMDECRYRLVLSGRSQTAAIVC